MALSFAPDISLVKPTLKDAVRYLWYSKLLQAMFTEVFQDFKYSTTICSNDVSHTGHQYMMTTYCAVIKSHQIFSHDDIVSD